MLQATTRIRLGMMAEPPAGEPKALPKALEDQRDTLQNSAREAINLMDRLVKEPAAWKRDDRPLTPAAALVQFAVAYSVQREPVTKADVVVPIASSRFDAVHDWLYLAEEAQPAVATATWGSSSGELIQFGDQCANGDHDRPEAAPQPVKDEADAASRRRTLPRRGGGDGKEHGRNAPAGDQGEPSSRVLEATPQRPERSSASGRFRLTRNPLNWSDRTLARARTPRRRRRCSALIGLSRDRQLALQLDCTPEQPAGGRCVGETARRLRTITQPCFHLFSV